MFAEWGSEWVYPARGIRIDAEELRDAYFIVATTILTALHESFLCAFLRAARGPSRTRDSCFLLFPQIANLICCGGLLAVTSGDPAAEGTLRRLS